MDPQSATIETPTPKSIKIKTFFKTYLKWVIIFLITVLFVIFLGILIISSNNSTPNNQKVVINDPEKTYELNKEYSFPLKDSNDKDVGKIKYTIENAQLMNEIVIKGQRATAVDGKTFLIINLKLINSLNQPIQINTRDYIRLIIDNNDQDLIAPDIHNDPVEIQPISTKFTRVGVPINENIKKIQLKVGEINGEKTTLDLNF